jgi:hypothetical protein
LSGKISIVKQAIWKENNIQRRRGWRSRQGLLALAFWLKDTLIVEVKTLRLLN